MSEPAGRPLPQSGSSDGDEQQRTDRPANHPKGDDHAITRHKCVVLEPSDFQLYSGTSSDLSGY